LRVDEHLTVPALAAAFTGFSDMPPVLATAFMVAFIEWACIEAVAGHLDPDQKTVGTHVDVSHVSASPIGVYVQADVEVIAVRGRTLRFRVRCTDTGGLIGEGFHERAVIDPARFMARLAAKAEKSRV
jgi:fluoroacetyl-CoA thioesterase